MLNFLRTTTVLFLLSLVIVSSGCKKDDDDDDSTPTSPSQEELLAGSTSKSWKITKVTVGGIDETMNADACELDNINTFSRNGTYQVSEGASKCNEADPDIRSEGTWEFNEDKTILNIGEASFTVVELTSSAMRLSITEQGVITEISFTVI